jgi:hypothetical protein
MKTSVFIPCIPKHFQYIPGIIRAYEESSVRPDEIVVFLSGADNRMYRYPNFDFKLFITSEKYLNGPARQMALSLCGGDVVLYQDADDLPSRQRVEIVKWYFENNDISLLTHRYTFRLSDLNRQPIDLLSIKSFDNKHIFKHYFPNRKINECENVCVAYGEEMSPHHAGACCIKRTLLNEIEWKPFDKLELLKDHNKKGEDYEFCLEAAFKVKKSIMIDAILYWYRTKDRE